MSGTIGLISDTHGLLRPEALEALAGVERIVHAGDIGRPEIVPLLEAIAPVTAIRGNIDTAEWALGHPETATVELFGKRAFVIHDRNDLPFDPAGEGYALVVSGHSHRPLVERVGSVLFVNPGSAGRKRFTLPVTLATLRLQNGVLEAKLHSLV